MEDIELYKKMQSKDFIAEEYRNLPENEQKELFPTLLNILKGANDINAISKLLNCSKKNILKQNNNNILLTIIDLLKDNPSQKLLDMICTKCDISMLDEKHTLLMLKCFYNMNLIAYIWHDISPEIQKSFLIDIIKQNNVFEIRKALFSETDSNLQKKLYNELIHEFNNPEDEFTIYLNGQAYLDYIHDENEVDSALYLKALRTYATGQIQQEQESDNEYKHEYIKALHYLYKQGIITKENANIIIEKLPTLGEEFILRIFQNNSTMVRNYAQQIIETLCTLPKEQSEKKLESIENIFGKNMPSCVKLYKYFDLIVNKKDNTFDMNSSIMSPVLKEASTKKGEEKAGSLKQSAYAKKRIFADLFNCAVDSNNKSLIDFVNILSEGNRIYCKCFIDGIKIEDLSTSELEKLREYTNSIFYMYENSGASRIDENDNTRIYLTENLKTDLERLARRYNRDEKIDNLPDVIWQSIIGPDKEMFNGLDTIFKIKETMEQ